MTNKKKITKANIKKSTTNGNRKPSNGKVHATKRTLQKTAVPTKTSTAIKTKSTQVKKSTPPKKGSKINLAITVFGVLLVLIVGIQIAMNPKPIKAKPKESNTTNSQKTAYPYFSNINNTFSTLFLDQLNDYRSNKGLSSFQRVRSISKGTTVTLQIPNIEQVAQNQNLNTETLLAEGVLHKFLESSNNVVVATADVPTVFLNTEMINGTLNLTVTVPYKTQAPAPVPQVRQPAPQVQRAPQQQIQQPVPQRQPQRQSAPTPKPQVEPERSSTHESHIERDPAENNVQNNNTSSHSSSNENTSDKSSTSNASNSQNR
ncbi:MAG: hypothetical protein ACRC30_04080 [Clostridium sp.]